MCKRADSLGCREVITTWVGLIEQEDKEVLMNIAMLSLSFMIVRCTKRDVPLCVTTKKSVKITNQHLIVVKLTI